ncbi:MAG TPA: alpha/beta hydrolase [Acidimicrobiales bacterium]|nr:alpha/beta hydrolase [Acidimicrobiales bacterium]
MLKAFAGGRLFGTVHGTPPPRVLALHGWARTHRDFDAVLDGLDALALDLPGFGATPAPDEAWGGGGYAAAVAPVLDDADEPVVVVGHSFGGRVAVHLATARPDRVRAVVLSGVPLVRPPGAVRRRPPAAYRLARALHRRGLLGDARMESLRQRYGSADYRAARGVMRAVHVTAVNETYEEQLRALLCPVELVWGADDADVPASVAEAAAALVPGGARLTLLPGVGHLVPTAAPEALRAAVDRALAL